MNLPRRIIQKQHESESYAILLYKLRKIGIFRNLTENDYGIDFEIEIVKNGTMTGKYVKVQVKSAETLKIRKKDNVPTVSGIKQSTLCYWAELSFSTNVLVFLVDVSNETIYITKPIFWQATRLIDRSDKTKTIEFLPVTEYHAEVAQILTSVYAQAPTIRDQVYFHVEAIRHLKQFIELYLGVFGYDAHMTIEDPSTFEHFLSISQKLLYYGKTVEKFPEEDRRHAYEASHWKNKTEYYELYNYVCQIPMQIILSDFLGELRRLRKRVIEGAYYWIHRDISYLRLVYIQQIPEDLEYERLAVASDQFEANQGEMEMEFSRFMDTFMKDENGKS